ncbi:MAG: hypothetical protein IPM47_11660 [Sphingobacteriales bacterium]|nr:MAG: hypothetical protein IPM47_11660 [Sphingobacteriales bacterium]
MKYGYSIYLMALLLAVMLFCSHCRLSECKKDENGCFPIACSKVHFNPPVNYEKVTYNDFWSKWTGDGSCSGGLDADWKGFYCHKEDTFKKLYLSFHKDRLDQKPSRPNYTPEDLADRINYIGSLMREDLLLTMYFDAEIDKNKDSLLISEVVGRSRVAWRYKRLDEFNEMQFTEPIDSMYHFEMTIRGRVFFVYDIARDTIFPIEEYRKEAVRIWNTIEFED